MGDGRRRDGAAAAAARRVAQRSSRQKAKKAKSCEFEMRQNLNCATRKQQKVKATIDFVFVQWLLNPKHWLSNFIFCAFRREQTCKFSFTIFFSQTQIFLLSESTFAEARSTENGLVLVHIAIESLLTHLLEQMRRLVGVLVRPHRRAHRHFYFCRHLAGAEYSRKRAASMNSEARRKLQILLKIVNIINSIFENFFLL